MAQLCASGRGGSWARKSRVSILLPPPTFLCTQGQAAMSRKRKSPSSPVQETKEAKPAKPLGQGGHADIWPDPENGKQVIKQLRSMDKLRGMPCEMIAEIAAYRLLGDSSLILRTGGQHGFPQMVLPKWTSLFKTQNVWKWTSEETFRWLAWDVLLHLEHTHAHRVVHGDVAIENIMLEEDGHQEGQGRPARARLIDWGSASFVACTHCKIYGRHRYRAPEFWLEGTNVIVYLLFR